MKVFNSNYKDISPGEGIFLDIETTGLKKESCSVYLIGLLYPAKEGSELTLIFAEDPKEEEEILLEFSSFLSGRKDPIITFNGDRFDLPFLLKRYEIHGFDAPSELKENESRDIYALLKPCRRAFCLSSLNQKAVEGLMGIKREDKYSGKELIEVYKTYAINRDPALLDLLITHNREDVIGMTKILPALSYAKVFYSAESEVSLETEEVLISIHSGFDGTEAAELMINYILPEPVVKPRLFHTGELFLRVRENTGSLRVPLFRGELKHFFSNYRDYLYIPSEDRAVLKTIGKLYSEKTEKASKDNCYVRTEGMFIPLPEGFSYPETDIYRKDLKEGPSYVRYCEELKEGGFFTELLKEYVKKIGME